MTRQEIRNSFDSKSMDMLEELKLDMHTLMLNAFDALTDEELWKLGDSSRPYLLIRAIAMAVGERALKDRFDAEAIKGLTPRIKKILEKRYWN